MALQGLGTAKNGEHWHCLAQTGYGIAQNGVEQQWLRIEKLRRGDDVLGSARAMGRNEVSGCGKGMIRYAREMKSGVRRSDGFDLESKAKA